MSVGGSTDGSSFMSAFGDMATKAASSAASSAGNALVTEGTKTVENFANQKMGEISSGQGQVPSSSADAPPGNCNFKAQKQ